MEDFAGLEICLMSSKMLQVSDDIFRLDQPDGWFRLFWRDRKKPNVLHGQGGFLAEVNNDTISVWSPCGTKLTLHRGRLTNVQIRDRELTYIFQNGKPVELREGSKSLIKLNTDPSTGKVNGLTLEGNKMVKLERTQRPIVQIVNGQAMIGGVMDTLGVLPPSTGRKPPLNTESIRK